MKQYRFPDTKMTRIGFGVFLFAMLLLARDTLITTCVLGIHKSQFLALGLIAVVGVAFLWVNRRDWKQILLDKRMLVILLSTTVILIPMLVKQDWQLMYFSILLCLYFAVFLTCFVSYREVARYYVVFMAVLGVLSWIATYLLKPMADAGILTVQILENSAGAFFYNFGLAFARKYKNYVRTYSIFREPGTYQFFLIVALYLNNYVLTWRKRWQLWTLNGILAATMLTTFSTNGVIEVMLLAGVLFLEKKLYKQKAWRVAVVTLAAVAIAVVVFACIQQGALYRQLYKMVIKLVTLNGSSSTRYEAIYADLMAFLRSPLVGANFADVLYAVKNNTTSTMILYAALGVAGGCLHVAAWIAFVWDRNRKLWINLTLLVVMFMSFNTQNISTDIFFWLFPMMALVDRGLPLLEQKLTEKKA